MKGTPFPMVLRVRVASTWIVLVIALAVRIFRAATEPYVNMDVIRFIRQGQKLFADPLGALRGEVYHPLHSFLGRIVHDLVTSHLLADDRFAWIAALKTVGVAAAVGVTWLIMRIARHLGAPWWAAAGAGLLWAVGRRTSTYGADGLSDCLFLFLFGWAVLLAMQCRMRPGAWRSLGIGAVSGMAYLTRPEGVAALLILALTLVLMALQRRIRGYSTGQSRIMPVRCILLMLVGFLLVAGPYMGVIGRFTGKKSVTINFYGGPSQTETGDRAIASGVPPMIPLAALRGDALGPKSPAGRIVMELWETFGWAPCIIMGLALAIKPRPWGRPQWRILVLVWMVLWVGVMLWVIAKTRTAAHPEGYLDGRHTLVLQLVLHGLFGLALQVWMRPMAWWQAQWRGKEAWARLPAWRRWKGWPHAESAIVLLLACLPGIIMLKDPPRADKAYLRDAANWIAGNTPPDTVIAFVEPTLSFYAQRGFAESAGTNTDAEGANLRATHAGEPVVLACVFQEALAKAPPKELGGCVAIKQFESRGALHGDVLVLYAPGGFPIKSR